MEKRTPTDEKLSKIPYNAATGRRGASDNPETWTTLENAETAYERGNYTGLAVFISLPYFFADFDHCRNPSTGVIHADVLEFVRRFDTYTEISQSGCGVKLIGKCSKFPSDTGKNYRRDDGKPDRPANSIITWGDNGGIELYGIKPKLFCYTLNHLEGTPDDIRDGTDALFELHTRLSPPKPKITYGAPELVRNVDDAEKLKRCLAYVAKMSRAISGCGGHNATVAVACEAVRFDLSDADALTALRDFNASLDEKWSDEELAHKLNGAKSMAGAERGIRLREDRPTPNHGSNGKHNSEVTGIPVTTPSGGPIVICLADIPAREVDWLWKYRIPRGRITLGVGRPGEGKTYVFAGDVAARVSTGSPFPDGSPCERGDVLIISGEDDPGDTLRPRLEAHHADLSRIHILSMVRRIGEDGKPFEVMFTLADLVALETALQRLPDCKLVIIDPIGSFLGGGTDSHRDNEVRSVLAPVAMLAEKYGCAVIVIAHRRKSGGSAADDLALGSRAFTGIARAVWHISRDKADKNRRLMLPGKNNLAPEGDGLAFTICGEPARVVWEADPVRMNADDALAIENDNAGPGRPANQRAGALEWLGAELADLSEHKVDDLKRSARDAGFAWRTIQRAADDLGVRRHRATFGGGFCWRLPKPGNDPSAMRATIVPTSHLTENIGTHGTIGKTPEKIGVSTVPISLPCHISLSGTNGEQISADDDYEIQERKAIQSAGM